VVVDGIPFAMMPVEESHFLSEEEEVRVLKARSGLGRSGLKRSRMTVRSGRLFAR
jgi:hypothetical protein